MKYIIDIPKEIAKASEEYWEKSMGMALVPYIESDRKAIEDEVWYFARRIICPSDCCEDSISKYTEKFLNIPSHKVRAIFKDLSYQEVKAKYEEWKKQKDEIRVGDEVCYVYDHQWKKIVATNTYSDGFDAIDSDGNLYLQRNPDMWEKTGRHFDEVEELLEKMRGEEE